MKLALVTGATGFIGAHVLRAVLDAGAEARAIARPGSDRANLDGLDVEVVDADLTDPDSLDRALAGRRHALPRRRALRPLPPRASRHLASQRAWRRPPDARRAATPGRPDRPHLLRRRNRQRREPELSGRRTALGRRQTRARTLRAHQDRQRATRPPDGRRRGPARGRREPHRPDRPARPQAHALPAA